ncbi:MAG: FAD-dependent oxidoreductase [Nitrospirae bacterium]|nr:FAD-dependent oxidoreductase [Nitrospirota bacterium]
MSLNNGKKEIVIMGGGLAGLSAGFNLVRARRPVSVFESDSCVGGLSRTIQHGAFKFDLGGHRFFTRNEETDRFVKDVLRGDYLTVHRKSKIYLRKKFFDYPLKPANALFGLGVSTTVRAVSDYGKEKIRNVFSAPQNISLEDWVVSNFGRTLFTIYFKEYSEKVWGIDCKSISEEWVSKRIEGLSLGVALKNALFKYSGRKVPTLVDRFIYPPLGIGQISDRLKEEIEKENTVKTNTRVSKISHKDSVITGITAKNCAETYDVRGSEFVSSIPLTRLVTMFDPLPPQDILEAASKLRYRDLVIVTLMLNREKVTDLTWLYLPEKGMPLGRIHEPKNWSPHMAPEGKTSIVAEYFCFRDDNIWNAPDNELTSLTARQLADLGLIGMEDVSDSCILRVPKAYPVFEVGYNEHYSRISEYLDRFKNLHIAGRTGKFKYYNIDHAIESGREAANNIIRKTALSRK